MSENKQIESPDFPRIKKLDGAAIQDAINTLWLVLNQELRDRSQTVQRAQNRVSPKQLRAAPASQQNDFDPGDTGTLLFTGSTAFALTGIRNGLDGRRLKIHNLGSGPITVKHEHAGSAASNRFDTGSGLDVAVLQTQTMDVEYANSRWRKANWV